MRVTRSHVSAVLAPGARLILPESVSTHLLRVLRLGVGARCILFNGDGSDYEAEIADSNRRGAEVEVLRRLDALPESPLRITLAQAIARGEKMDWVLQKATELGVHALVPLITERTEVRLDGERVDRRLAHWQGVVAAACEQSGRATLPGIAAPRTLQDWLSSEPAIGYFLDPVGDRSLREVAVGLESVSLVVGPEGGWGERDLAQLRQAGWSGLRFGPRILRTETAGIAAIAALQSLCGDLG